jgi:hypothetical protein
MILESFPKLLKFFKSVYPKYMRETIIMSIWQSHPIIYQINTLVWLNTLSRRYGKTITLSNIPTKEIEELASYHIQCVWLMGIWHRGAECRASALNYVHEYRGALPDVTNDDVVGSAYAIGDYSIDLSIGGKQGLQTFRKQLSKHNIKLILDWVPNHVGKDHWWLKDHPEYFVQGTPELLEADTTNFFRNKNNNTVIAHGRDPYFPGWIDTAQLNAFSKGYREAAIDTLKEIASMCDGVRCDMAMLMMNDVFLQTWGWRGVQPLKQSFWTHIIGTVKKASPDFLFIAEVYWGLEYALHLEGFDYTYDKTLYDRLLEGNVDGMYHHLSAHIDFIKKNIRFIENHDEPRAASSLGIERSRPAAVMIHTLPGAVLLHDGQFVGRRIKLPVQITRQPNEYEHPALYQFYKQVLEEASHDIYRYGKWTLFPRQAMQGGVGHHNIIAYGWVYENDYRLIVLNMNGSWSQAQIDLSQWTVLGNASVEFRNVLQNTTSEYDGLNILEQGLNVDLDPFSARIYHLKLSRKRQNKFFGLGELVNRK